MTLGHFSKGAWTVKSLKMAILRSRLHDIASQRDRRPGVVFRLFRDNQSQALTSLLVPTRIADLVRNECLALLGTLGVLVGLALASTIRTRVDRPAAALAHALRNVSTTSAPTRTRTASQSRKPLTCPENASTESDTGKLPGRRRLSPAARTRR